LGDKQLAELAFQGLLPTLREKNASFESLSQLVSRMSQETAKSYEPRRNFQKKISYVDYSDSEDEDNTIGLAEWVKGKNTMSCPVGKKEPEKLGFDITKADKIFDLLLQQWQIKLSQFHTIPFAEELKRMKYCKWHNATSHDTNDCKIFRQHIQSAIEQGRLKFETPTKAEKPMKIDQHPFPTNMVEVSSKDTSRVKLLTSDLAQNTGAVDPKLQVTAADVKEKWLLLEEDLKPRRPVMSKMLINKFQRRQEKAKEREDWARSKEGHWRCPFFKYCWEEGIKLPTTENCPECNRAYNNNSSSKRACFGDRKPATKDHRGFDNQLVSVHDRLGGKASVHDQLGARLAFMISWEARSMKSQTIG
jgi:hypothetical protein